jgi:hypothetical protein
MTAISIVFSRVNLIRTRICWERWLALGAILLASASQFSSAAVDINLDALGRDKGAAPADADQQPVQVAKVGDAFAFSFQFRIVELNADPVNWGFPVKETAATQWVKDNKNPFDPFSKGTAGAANFSGLSEGLNHAHDTPLDHTTAGNADYFGPHPHTQLSIWMQPSGTGALVKVGNSDLKHAFATTHDTVSDHFLEKDEQDTYNVFSNADRDFLGPMDELNTTTFAVPDHKHLGTDTGTTFMNATTGNQPFKIYERSHGEKDETDPLEHRLTARKANLLTQADGGNAPNGSKFFFAASIYYFDTSLATPGREQNLNNNTVFRQFNPGWDGTNFNPVWTNAKENGVRLKDDGTMKNFVAFDQPGFFLEPMMHMAVPEASTLALLFSGLPTLLAYIWRRRPARSYRPGGGDRDSRLEFNFAPR